MLRDLAELDEGRARGPRRPAGAGGAGPAAAASDPVATRSIGRTIPSRCSADDHVLIAVPHQRRQDLPVAGQVAEMADGFAEQGITAFQEKG